MKNVTFDSFLDAAKYISSLNAANADTYNVAIIGNECGTGINVSGVLKDALSYVSFPCVFVSLDLSKSIMKIDNNAFSRCTALKSVKMPVVSSIGKSAFEECTSLESITLCEGLKEIGEFSFKHCTSLMSIEIPETVTEIGCSAFYKCIKLDGNVFKKVHLWGASTEKDSKILLERELHSIKSEEMGSFYWHCLN